MSLRRTSTSIAAALVCAAAVLGTATQPATAEPDESQRPAELCLRAQTETANLHVNRFERKGGELHEVAYSDLAAFAASKPQIQPLTVTRYTTYEGADTTLPKQLRCKGKSADHIAAVYGRGIAGPEGTCADVNRTTLKQVARSLTHDERNDLIHKPNSVVIDPDTAAVTGQDWLSDFPTATQDSTNKLHLPSKSLLVPLDTPGIPDAFKGQHYCTLIDPAYLKRLLLGHAHP